MPSWSSYTREEIVLISVDADNGFSGDFVPSCMELCKEGFKHKLFAFHGDDGGVTGRMGCWASSFWYVNGYGQSLRGCGYQDIAFLETFRKIPGYTVVKPLNKDGRKFSAGWSMCNGKDGDLTKAYNQAKVNNCDPKDQLQ